MVVVEYWFILMTAISPRLRVTLIFPLTMALCAARAWLPCNWFTTPTGLNIPLSEQVARERAGGNALPGKKL